MLSVVISELTPLSNPAFPCTKICRVGRICACFCLSVFCLCWRPAEGNHVINQPSIKSAAESVKSAWHLTAELLVAGTQRWRIFADFLHKRSLLERKTQLDPQRHFGWSLMKHVSSTWWNRNICIQKSAFLCHSLTKERKTSLIMPLKDKAKRVTQISEISDESH